VTNFKLIMGDEKLPIGYELTGHASNSIVCAAISALAHSTAEGLEKVLNLDVVVETDEQRGYMKCTYTIGYSDCKYYGAFALIKTLVNALQSVERDYPGNVIFIMS